MWQNINKPRFGIILSLFLMTVILGGCSGKAISKTETETKNERASKAELTAQTPETRSRPYSEMSEYGDFDYETPPVKSSTTAVISKAKFGKIKVGMTLQEVEQLIGDQGLKVSTMIVNGKETEIYKWSNESFTRYIDVIVEKNKVVEKKEKGLK